MLPPTLPQRVATTLALAGLFGASAVALGAFGAHALAARLAGHPQQIWQTAVFYHALHAVALLALAALQPWLPQCWALDLASWAFAAGTVLFSGSLYLLSLGGPRWLGPITPVGGLFLLLGWGSIAAAALRRG